MNIYNKNDWYKLKKYPHIGLPIQYSDQHWIAQYVKNPANISKHSFFPLLHKKITVRKFRRKIDENGVKEKLRSSSPKTREIFYATHLDANVYSYYAELISQRYEKYLKDNNMSESVIAYRKIPLKNNKRNCCNVDFAEEVFEYIRNNTNNHLISLTFDIKSFFDNLDHALLKKLWCNILNSKSLPDDHYNIFRNITNFSYCDELDIFNEFKKEIWVENNSKTRRKKLVAKKKYLFNQNAIAFCEKSQFKERILNKGYVKCNKFKTKKGIPQGSPISSVLANFYLIDFDFKINSIVKKIHGLYRRYSDDMIVVCDSKYQNLIKKLFEREIKKVKLEIQPSKTKIFHFEKKENRFFTYSLCNGLKNFNKRFEYLGFEFDGHDTFIKSSSLSKFYRNMKRCLSRARFYCFRTKKQENRGIIFRRRLYKKFSYLGAERRRIYTRDKKLTNKWIMTPKFDWGNFITYAKLAMQNMKNNKIQSQISNHWKILNTIISDIESDYKNDKSTQTN